ncbi:hypothetical protein VOLCADRAFT_106899 [Volvox carteri f. nagariensis]|uniref:Ribulose bisphosphate carboxylase small subunit, chloroplastic n=1 Tax=Volvox carteri f. nagariensis TaxID=3068 RepID=D8UAH0_VOLCA|nr:uncharacterized protein VOLCADRAFT_106899 [Volvox carteri f. nagariensis]EFJ43322.1 hypothetical protein VOLCADRAFT_106899 [Volvox carteri f. nagariensis]|eukprot:XP_002955682.1 hypothetical protein VOLCADRAFT_106899 [Volvox carteri f. nagariensis]
MQLGGWGEFRRVLDGASLRVPVSLILHGPLRCRFDLEQEGFRVRDETLAKALEKLGRAPYHGQETPPYVDAAVWRWSCLWIAVKVITLDSLVRISYFLRVPGVYVVLGLTTQTANGSSRSVRPCAVLKPAVKAATVAAPAQANKMMVWTPVNNKMFETFSYLPPLTDEQIAAQVDYIVANGWIPCLEFAEADKAYVSNESTVRFGPVSCLYYDNRYWTMWKLPMFGCRDPMQVLREIVACTKAFPDAYVRLVAFDNVKQVQIMGFLVQRPKSARDWQPANKRSV